jgi:ribose transport system substrate-binding protein
MGIAFSIRRGSGVLAALILLLAACNGGAPATTDGDNGNGNGDTGSILRTSESCEGAAESEFFDADECERQLAQRTIEPEGPADQPWLQALEPEYVDTSEFASEEDGSKICFSNAGVNNPWRVVGYNTMEHEVQIQTEAGEIGEFVHIDAGGDDNKQISDISDLLGQDCDALIVSPNTTAALTPAVEQACETGIPVITFDRGVNTDCPVTHIQPIGGYAFGADAAEFIVDNVPEGGNVLMLRILPGVDVLETRYAAGTAIFEQHGINVVGAEFTDGDPAQAKSIVSDYLQREEIDGVWMDAGAVALGAIEAFEDAGLEVPPITGEDQQDFLVKWSEDGLTAVAPTYPTYQWRTPILAAVMILNGEQVPSPWVLPEPVITDENLDQYLQPDMPPLHYALCGCEEMPGFPEDWQ